MKMKECISPYSVACAAFFLGLCLLALMGWGIARPHGKMYYPIKVTDGVASPAVTKQITEAVKVSVTGRKVVCTLTRDLGWVNVRVHWPSGRHQEVGHWKNGRRAPITLKGDDQMRVYFQFADVVGAPIMAGTDPISIP
jgi:hypothetical protein